MCRWLNLLEEELRKRGVVIDGYDEDEPYPATTRIMIWTKNSGEVEPEEITDKINDILVREGIWPRVRVGAFHLPPYVVYYIECYLGP